jgi:hypothetical protein
MVYAPLLNWIRRIPYWPRILAKPWPIVLERRKLILADQVSEDQKARSGWCMLSAPRSGGIDWKKKVELALMSC